MAENKTTEIMEQLEKGILETLSGEKYKAFLNVQSQFHSYSFNNAMLIYLQKPDATRIAGYSTWKKLGRQVLKGEKGIGILAPNPYKYEKLVDRVENGKPIKDPITGKTEKVKAEFQKLTFRKVSVFDISQTDGKELPSICSELIGDSKNAEKIIKAIKGISNVPILEQAIPGGAKGYYSRAENLIALKEGMSLDQTAKTLVHEYAHSQLHSSEAMSKLDRATKEVQAESVAYVISNHYGLDTSDYSFEYLANWSNGKDLKELKTSFDLIQKTANKIIDDMDTSLSKSLSLETQISTPEVPAYKLFYSGEQDKEAIAFQEKNNYKRIWVPENKGANGDVWAVYKNIDSLPKWLQTFANGQELNGQDITIDNRKVKDIIKEKTNQLYNQEFPSIKYIGFRTAKAIERLNDGRDVPLTVKEIRQRHKDLGKRLEQDGYSKEDLQEFKDLQDVVDDFKNAQLINKQKQAQTHAIENMEIAKVNIIEY